MTHLPDFDQLPKLDNLPQGCAWGVFDRDGEKDELGTLNLLTPEVVASAASEISVGVSVALNWGLDKPTTANWNRKQLDHKLIDHEDISPHYHGFDDEIHLNTQCSSQWDGFRHHALLSNHLFYNGVHRSAVKEPGSSVLGMQKWSERGGIVGRGVLIDYVAYAERHGIKYSPVATHHITVEALEEAAKEQSLEFKPGDILLVRSGVVKWHNAQTDASMIEEAIGRKTEFVGVQGCKKTVQWIWNRHFAALAGDTPAFESLPITAENQYILHDWCLSHFGCPLGEFWDLEKLAETCQAQKRWSFFFTSAPLNVPGGVASPPNALAIF